MRSTPDRIAEHIELGGAEVHAPDRAMPGGERRPDLVDDDRRI
ncbi:MAG: hypothetical protein V4515_10300 [Chloroflexota bacterium]